MPGNGDLVVCTHVAVMDAVAVACIVTRACIRLAALPGRCRYYRNHCHATHDEQQAVRVALLMTNQQFAALAG